MPLDKDITDRWRKSEILLLGGSAGSFKLIYNLVKNFDAQLNKTVIIVIHRKKNFFSDIEKLFGDSSRMIFREIMDKDKVRKNNIYIAPANYHTLIEKERTFSLDVSEAIWYSKPSIDVTFESAADVYKDACTAILFSGANEDGAQGMLKLRNYGSLTIVQDPEEAEMSQMPLAAIQANAAEYVLNSTQIAALLGRD